MTAIKFSEADYSSLNQLFSGGDISSCSKVQLERFAVMLSRPRAYEYFGASSFPQICETVRTLILVRLSEEQNVQANKESRLALIISCVALLAGIVQAVASILQLTSNAPVVVQASAPLPVRAVAPIPVVTVASPPPQPPKAEQVPKK